MTRENLTGSYVMGAEAAFWTAELFLQPLLTFYQLEKQRRQIPFATYAAQRALLTSLSVQVSRAPGDKFLLVAYVALT